MPLTPADVANVAFSKPPIGKRGYHEDEVDAFLDLLEAELAGLIEENNDLRNHIEQLDAQQRATPVDTGPHLFPVEPPRPVMAPSPPPMEQSSPAGDHNAHAAKVLGLAQAMADQLAGEARAEADAMVGDAHTRAEQVLFDARVKAEGLVNEATTRAETMLTDARTSAEAVERQFREKVASLEREVTRRHTEIIGALSHEKSALEKKIEDLRAVEREYRTRLKTYLAAQLRELDQAGSGGPGALVGNRQGLVVSEAGAHAEAGSR
ncbi:MAG: DivIVA domain-containing protein [Pseudonocardiales bacterium]|jgi:DivIVA domain-containing protein|nr:DivIVA domain-containing protein [Pseudonocardiales bacterium]MBV9648839.1 DivIVA domain-containing protein [Pseudonocardiales bacterium]